MSEYDFDVNTNDVKEQQNERISDTKVVAASAIKEEVKREKTNSSYDTSKLVPNIPEGNVPFIVLCGPPNSGKSMVLKCLASYLYNHENLNYAIEANETLLPTQKYQDDCKEFNRLIGLTDEKMPNTVDYLMADVTDEKGDVVAHFLEAPGEDFFSLDNLDEEPKREFKSYLDKIAQTTSKTRRKVIYIILLDLDTKCSVQTATGSTYETTFRIDPNLRRTYQDKMKKLYNRYVPHSSNRVILLYNKADVPKDGKWASPNGCLNLPAITQDAKKNYPGLFFKEKKLFWEVDACTFLPFCTGSYADGSYIASGPNYSAELWKEITRLW